jgi:hypothetical protein
MRFFSSRLSSFRPRLSGFLGLFPRSNFLWMKLSGEGNVAHAPIYAPVIVFNFQKCAHYFRFTKYLDIIEMNAKSFRFPTPTSNEGILNNAITTDGEKKSTVFLETQCGDKEKYPEYREDEKYSSGQGIGRDIDIALPRCQILKV